MSIVEVVYQPPIKSYLLACQLRLRQLTTPDTEPAYTTWKHIEPGDCIDYALTPAVAHEQLFDDSVEDLYHAADVLSMVAVAEAVRYNSEQPCYLDPNSGFGVPEYQRTERPQQLAVVAIKDHYFTYQTLSLAVLSPQSVPALVRLRARLSS